MKSIAEERPAVPAVDLIRLLHRAGGSYVSFNAIIDGRYENLFAIRADDLPLRFAELRGYLGLDAFFSVNGFHYAWGKSRFVPDLPAMCRHAKNVSRFNACFIDVDCYNAGIVTADVLAAVEGLQAGGAIPAASIIAESGKGVWFFWLLQDAEDRSKPPRARGHRIEQYRRIQEALKTRFARFAPDAIDSARTVRVPGSVNSKSGATVAYRAALDSGGEPVAYTLDELAATLGVAMKKPARAKGASEPKDPVKQRAHQAMQERRLRQFEKLRAIRGGFSEGCRNRAALLYVVMLKANRLDVTEIERRLEALARECDQPLRMSQCRDALNGAKKPRKFSDQTIADWLLVTPAEAAQLEGWPAARRYGGCKPPKPTRRELADARRKLIVEFVGKPGGVVPSLAAMKELLEDHGHTATPRTISKDYQALGAPAEREYKGVGVAAGLLNRRILCVHLGSPQ